MIAAASVERPQVRKVRASQGRMPDNVRWRKGSVRDYRGIGNNTGYVNPIRSKTKYKAIRLPVVLLGRLLEPAGNSRSR